MHFAFVHGHGLGLRQISVLEHTLCSLMAEHDCVDVLKKIDAARAAGGGINYPVNGVEIQARSCVTVNFELCLESGGEVERLYSDV